MLYILTETKSSQTCSLCEVTPKDFLSIKDFQHKKFKQKTDNLKYGICPMHCWICFFEFALEQMQVIKLTL